MLLDSDLVLKKSANHPSSDSGTAGGAMTSTLITNSTVGEWFPRMRALTSGTIDNAPDIKKQHQKVFVHNTSLTDSLLDGLIYLLNGIKIPSTTGLVTIQSDNAADNATKRVRLHLKKADDTGGFENIILNGTSLVAGITSSKKAFRATCQDTSTGAAVAATGNISIFINGEYVGMIPAGYKYATGELRLWPVATLGDSGTSTNRITAPAGSSFVLATSLASAVSIKNNPADDTLGSNQAQGLWGELALQPGSEPAPDLQLPLQVYGDGT